MVLSIEVYVYFLLIESHAFLWWEGLVDQKMITLQWGDSMIALGGWFV